MFDSHTYMLQIYNRSDDHAECVSWLETLSAVMLDKSRVVKVIAREHLAALLKQSGCPTSVINTLVTMIDNNDLKLLPRLAKSYRRKLAQENRLVVDITTRNAYEAYDAQAFGSNAIVIHHIDPELIAGARVVTPSGSYELSARSMLAHIQNTLKNRGERTA